MNAVLARVDHEIQEHHLRVPEAALTQLGLRLGRDRAAGKVWDASLSHGVPPDALARLVDYWCDDFDFRIAEASLNALPLFAGSFRGQQLCFAHVRSSQPDALPLLLLHGGSGSIMELMPLFGPLSAPVRHGLRETDAFHVVCPALPGFGWSCSNAETCLASIAAACSELMARLGYERYLAHGSDVGAGVARALAASDQARLAGAHVTACPAFPPPDPLLLATLSREEKSQLALIAALDEAEPYEPAASAVEQLALAMSQLLEVPDSLTSSPMADRLLAGLTLSALEGDAELQVRLRRQARCESEGSSTPLSVCAFPLDAPCLRRFAERRHRIAEWVEQERGGNLPGLEQPELLLSSLLSFYARFR